MHDVGMQTKPVTRPTPDVVERPAAAKLDSNKATRLAFLDVVEVATTSAIAGAGLLAAPYVFLPHLAPLFSSTAGPDALVNGALAAVGTGASIIGGLAMHRASRMSAEERAALAGPESRSLYARLDTVRAMTFAAPLSVLITFAAPLVGAALLAVQAVIGDAAASAARRQLTDIYKS